MNSPQSPCAFAEPRSALLRPFASSASCWFRLPRFPIRPSSLATPVFESLCACFHLFSELLNLRFQRIRAACPIAFGSIQKRPAIFYREFHRPAPETDRQAPFSPSPAAPASPPDSVARCAARPRARSRAQPDCVPELGFPCNSSRKPAAVFSRSPCQRFKCGALRLGRRAAQPIPHQDSRNRRYHSDNPDRHRFLPLPLRQIYALNLCNSCLSRLVRSPQLPSPCFLVQPVSTFHLFPPLHPPAPPGRLEDSGPCAVFLCAVVVIPCRGPVS